MADNRFFVSNTEEFFEGLVALLQQCGLCCQERSKTNSSYINMHDIDHCTVLGVQFFPFAAITRGSETFLPLFISYSFLSSLLLFRINM